MATEGLPKNVRYDTQTSVPSALVEAFAGDGSKLHSAIGMMGSLGKSPTAGVDSAPANATRAVVDEKSNTTLLGISHHLENISNILSSIGVDIKKQNEMITTQVQQNDEHTSEQQLEERQRLLEHRERPDADRIRHLEPKEEPETSKKTLVDVIADALIVGIAAGFAYIGPKISNFFHFGEADDDDPVKIAKDLEGKIKKQVNPKSSPSSSSPQSKEKSSSGEQVPGNASPLAANESPTATTTSKPSVGSKNTTDKRNPWMTKRATEAMNFFTNPLIGYSKDQAAGIVANLQAESGPNLDIMQKPSNMSHYGIAQWDKTRQAAFKRVMRKDVRQSSFQDQLSYVAHELKYGEGGNIWKELVTGEGQHAVEMKRQKNAADSAELFYRKSERAGKKGDANYARDVPRRTAIANQLSANYGTGASQSGLSLIPPTPIVGPQLAEASTPSIKPKPPQTTSPSASTSVGTPPSKQAPIVGVSDVPNPSASSIMREYQLYFTSSAA